MAILRSPVSECPHGREQLPKLGATTKAAHLAFRRLDTVRDQHHGYLDPAVRGDATEPSSAAEADQLATG